MLTLKVARTALYVASWAGETFQISLNELVAAGHVAAADYHLGHIGIDELIIARKITPADTKARHVRSGEIVVSAIVSSRHSTAVQVGISKVSLDTRSAKRTPA